MGKAFKIYVGIMLLLIVLLLGTLVVGLAYAGKHASTQTTNAEHKIDTLSNSLNTVNTDLGSINAQLKTNNSDLTREP